VFLLRDGKTWRFPKNKKELPCPIKPLYRIPILGQTILYSKPILKHHPEHWFHKDAVIGQADIDGLVQKAVNRTLPRGAAKVAIVENGQVLMVKACRGLTKDMWNLPGGFIGYGEHPSVSAQRELIEEIGVRVKLIRLLGIYSERFERTGGYMLSFVYLGKRLNAKIKLDRTEIAEIRWMPIAAALRVTKNPFAKAGLKDFLKKK
jgi:ADP-ribose pyrophosphatase YjhB (NUDIX family)